MKELEEIRREIDELDRGIVDLYERRMALVEEVAAYKMAKGLSVRDDSREEEKLKELEQTSDAEGVRELFEEILQLSRARQEEILEKGGNTAKKG